MSGSAAKATRRDLRRAFGEEGLQRIEEILARHSGQFQQVAEAHNSMVATLRDHGASFVSFVNQPLLGRLRWLFTGTV